MITRQEKTFWVKIYISGPIEVAKQILRREFLKNGLCVTIEPTLFIYKGGEEPGYVVGLVNYPRFPSSPDAIWSRAIELANLLMEETFQESVLVESPSDTIWITKRQ